MKVVKWSDINPRRANDVVLSPATIHNGFVFTAGSTGSDLTTGVLPKGDIELQTINTMKSMDLTLSKSGSSIKNVLKCLVFIKRPEDRAIMNKIYSEYFQKKGVSAPPARSCVVVDFPNPDILVEIECIAATTESIKAKL